VDEFAEVARRLDVTEVEAIEVNLSCPNVEGESIWALEPSATAEVMSAVRSSTGKPIGAKLSPDASNIVEIAAAALGAGADWLVLTNTITGAAIDVETRRPVLTRTSGGYSGPPLKPIALRCVIEVYAAFPEAAIVGCGGVRHGNDVVEYLLAGASAVAIGTAHFEQPRIGRTIINQLRSYCRKHGINRLSDLKGAMRPW
jgi:dihydroorotate dehydrogenase (NAD+) catalytic subunit